jgi:hypothetical protein
MIAIYELLACTDPEVIKRDLLTVREMLLRVPRSKFTFAADYLEALDLEQRTAHSGVIEAPGRKADRQFLKAIEQGGAELEEQIQAQAEPIRRKLAERKADLFNNDRTLSTQYVDELGEDFTAERACALLASKEVAATDFWVEYAVKQLHSRYSAAQIRADRRRFRLLHALSHFGLRILAANCVPKEAVLTPEQDALLRLWRTPSKSNHGPGTWYDVAIAVLAAYADVFVTRDASLRGRCEFLRKLDLVSFRSVDLAGVLST